MYISNQTLFPGSNSIVDVIEKSIVDYKVISFVDDIGLHWQTSRVCISHAIKATFRSETLQTPHSQTNAIHKSKSINSRFIRLD